jgi:monofunctional chorismate mutase
VTALRQPRTRPVRVGVQGEPGSYSHAALAGPLAAVLGPLAAAVPFDETPDAVRALAGGGLDYVLLPIENAITGLVAPTLSALAAHPGLHVVAEATLPIDHCLAAVPGSSLDAIRTVASHPVALAQCGAFLARHPAMSPRPVHDTAGAARLVAERGDPTAAAVASRTAAALHGLVVLADDVADRYDNATRFWLLAQTPRPRDGATAARLGRHAAVHLEGRPLGLRAYRGATTVAADTPAHLREATAELLAALLSCNGLTIDRIVSAIFTTTPDLASEFPAVAAREAGWSGVPLICASEIPVRNALPRCIRVLLHASGAPDVAPRHVYLRDARGLRPDLSIG